MNILYLIIVCVISYKDIERLRTSMRARTRVNNEHVVNGVKYIHIIHLLNHLTN